MKKYLIISLVLISFLVSFGNTYAQVSGISNPLGGLQDVTEFVSSVLGFVVKIAAVFAVIALIYAGFLYVQARGNPKGLEKAHTTLKNTIIGIVLLLGAQLIASIITGTIEALKR